MMPRMVDLRLFSDGMIIREGISHPVCVHTDSFTLWKGSFLRFCILIYHFICVFRHYRYLEGRLKGKQSKDVQATPRNLYHWHSMGKCAGYRRG